MDIHTKIMEALSHDRWTSLQEIISIVQGQIREAGRRDSTISADLAELENRGLIRSKKERDLFRLTDKGVQRLARRRVA